MDKRKLKMMSSGIFYLKLVYCLPVFGNVFGLDRYKDTISKSPSFTSSDCLKLQVLQNSVNRLLTGARQGVSTADLLRATNTLSIHQMIAYHTLVMVHKIINTGKPSYIAERLKLRSVDGRGLRGHREKMVVLSEQSLAVSRKFFFFTEEGDYSTC